MFDLFKRDAEPDRRPWGERLKAGLGLSRERLTRPLNAVFGRRTLSEEMLEELEAALLEADVGVPATTHLLAQLAARTKRADIDVDARTLLKIVLTELLLPLEQPLIVGPERPFVMMIAGVNGTGKTTSIGKLAKYLQGQGGSPHDALLVLDANTGQNALAQVAAFDAALDLTGLVLTKLDGTAKGGVVAAIAKTQPIPIKLIGIGEGLDDLRAFRAAEFV